MFITVEGVDGAGKSTLSRALAEELENAGHEVVLTREPGGSPGAEEIRSLIISGESDRWSPETELLLFNAARRDHVERTIRPALAKGTVVICDRYVDSTRAYQGQTPEMRARIDDLHASMIGLDPDLTLLLDVAAEDGLERGVGVYAGETRFEDRGNLFMKSVREAFLGIARDDPDRVRVIDASCPQDVVLKACLDEVREK